MKTKILMLMMLLGPMVLIVAQKDFNNAEVKINKEVVMIVLEKDTTIHTFSEFKQSKLKIPKTKQTPEISGVVYQLDSVNKVYLVGFSEKKISFEMSQIIQSKEINKLIFFPEEEGLRYNFSELEGDTIIFRNFKFEYELTRVIRSFYSKDKKVSWNISEVERFQKDSIEIYLGPNLAKLSWDNLDFQKVTIADSSQLRKIKHFIFAEKTWHRRDINIMLEGGEILKMVCLCPEDYSIKLRWEEIIEDPKVLKIGSIMYEGKEYWGKFSNKEEQHKIQDGVYSKLRNYGSFDKFLEYTFSYSLPKTN